MAGDYKLIDGWSGWVEPPSGDRTLDPNITKWFRPEGIVSGATLEAVIADMDAAGIEKSVLTDTSNIVDVPRPNSPYARGWSASDEQFAANCRKLCAAKSKYPDRLHLCIYIDPTLMMRSVRRLEQAVKEYGFASCWMFPAEVGLPANHAAYFPMYAKCVELGIPVKINVGMPGPMRMAWVQQPVHLDEVLLAFPELVVVGTHVGHPWHVETVALLQKYPNFYLMTSGWAPKHVPQEIWNVANASRTRDKVMWASDYPLLSMQRCAKEGWELPLKDEAKRGYLRDNALKVFKFD